MVDQSSPETAELLGNLPLQYEDGPDYCTVTDATGGAFALTVQPELMKAMERALRGVAQAPVKSAMTAQGALDIAANIADAIDSGRGNEKEIARAIRRVAKDGYWTRDGSLVSSTPHQTHCDGADDLEHLDGMLDDRERG